MEENLQRKTDKRKQALMQMGKTNGKKPNMKAECSHAQGAGQSRKPNKCSSKYVWVSETCVAKAAANRKGC